MMPRNRRNISHSQYHAAATHAIGEVLESRQLLSATSTEQNSNSNLQDYCSSAVVDVAAGYQWICVSEVVDNSGHELRIEEVWEVGKELWVLSRLTGSGMNEAGVSTVKDGLTVESNILRQRHFRIGGTGLNMGSDPNQQPNSNLTLIENLADFHSRISGQFARQVFGESDPQLTLWREQHRQRLTADADATYGHLFGTRADLVWYEFGNTVIPLGTGSVAMRLQTEGDINLDSLSISDTNVQVDGVDEADIVETDGEFIYTLSNKELVIIRANASVDTPPEVVSRTEFSLRPDAMFLYDGKLTVISRTLYDASILDLPRFPGDAGRRVNLTTVTVFDVTKPDAPEVLQESIIDGQYVTSRAIGAEVYVVVNNTGIPHLPVPAVVFGATAGSEELRYRYQTREEYLEQLNQTIDASAPPAAYRRTADGHLSRIEWLDDSSLTNHQVTLSGSMTNIVQFDTTRDEPGPVDSVSAGTGDVWQAHVYASEDALYLLTQESGGFRTTGFTFRIQQDEPHTLIHQINLDGEPLKVVASGRVKGTVDSQFSVDEHNGYLRVATTTGALWNQTSANHVWILQNVGGQLELAGSIQDLAPTETIYSMRYDGDRAWMVTFRKVDPVYALDLSDPTDPKVTGELKIPGYSDYLQLIDENHLLSIGRGATDSGSPQFALFQEVQVSLFDISNPESPALLHRYSFEGGRQGQSEALIDHRAFHYLPDRQYLSIPFASPEPGRWSWDAGLITLHIDPDNGITRVGDVDQPGSITRSVRIGEQLFGISSDAVSAVGLDAPNELIATVPLQAPTTQVRRHEDLIYRYLRRVNDIYVFRFNDVFLNNEHIFVGIGDRPRNWNLTLRNERPRDIEYEFLIRDAASGIVWLQATSRNPWLQIRNPLDLDESGDDSKPLPDQLTVQFRTRSALTNNARWTGWSQADTITLNDAPEITTAEALTFGNAALQWTEIAERGSVDYAAEPWLSLPNFEGNPASHYEIWVTDAITRQRVLWNRNVSGTDFDMSHLNAGRFWVWVRAVFEDETFSNWSTGTVVELLGQKPTILSDIDFTATQTPAIFWEDLADASGYELEITSADDGEVIYTAQGGAEGQHHVESALTPGSYLVRVRGVLNGVYTEWSDPYRFGIAGRPVLRVQNDSVFWDVIGAERFEVWINDSESGERLFHATDWSDAYIDDIGQLAGIARGRVDIWVKAYMPDGSATKWSGKTVATILAAPLTIDPIDEFRFGQLQRLSWASHTDLESVEVYIQRDGEPGAVYRQSDIQGTSHVLSEALPSGDYEYWIRGLLKDGTRTRWGIGQTLHVSNRPITTLDNGHIMWTTGANTTGTELWINRISIHGRLLESRVIHALDLENDRFDFFAYADEHQLENGYYAVWTRTTDVLGDITQQSDWSNRALAILLRPPGFLLRGDHETPGEILHEILDHI